LHVKRQEPVGRYGQVSQSGHGHGGGRRRGGVEIVSVITRSSAEALNLQPGDPVKAVIKSTEVMIDK
jgi:hypothetical protein